MSAETFSPNEAEFRLTTTRGTEVSPSRTGNRIIDAANRVANFLDRFKLGRQEAVEHTQDALEQGRQFLQNTGEAAVKAAVAGGEIALGVAILGAEAAGQGLAKGGQAAMEGAQKAGAWLETKGNAAQAGVETAVNWATDKYDAAKQLATDTAGYVEEGLRGGVDYTKQKGTELKEAAVDRVEAVKSFFKERAEAAKARREARREKWAARITAGKDAVRGTIERGKEKGAEFRAKAQKRGNAALRAVHTARLVYNVASK